MFVWGVGAGLQGLWLLTRVAADLTFHLIVDPQHLHFPSNLLVIFSLSWAKYVYKFSSVQCSHSVMSDSLRPYGLQHSRLPCPITNSQSLLKLMSIESVMPTNHLILCCPLLFPPSTFSSIRVFSSVSVLCKQKLLKSTYSEGLLLKLKLQYFGHLMRRADSLEKTLMLGNI